MKAFYSAVATLFFLPMMAQKDYRLLIGTYTNACKSDGIYVYDFNLASADAKLLSKSDFTENPSFLTVSSDSKKIWAVKEGGDSNSAAAFSFDPKKGKLKLLNEKKTNGADPCFIMEDQGNVIAANYSGGSISVFKADRDGKLSDAIQVIQHEGKSVTKRQEGPHVHQTQLSPDKKFLIANDLGTDRIYVYRYYPTAERQVLELQDTVPVKTGSGPRHLAFSPNGNFAYLLQELDGTLTAYKYSDGKFSRIQETTVVQPGFKGDISAAAIKISADGRFLYATNRGDANTISTYNIGGNGRLSLIETIPTGGKGPRDFTFSPDGKYLLISHQYTNDVIIFNRDNATGKLTDSGKKIELCSPVNLVFAPVN